MANYIGKKLRILRQQRGWTLKLVADCLDVSIPAYSKIETGYTDVNLSRLEQIAHIFGISVLNLFTETDTGGVHTDNFKTIHQNLRDAEKRIIELQNELIGLHEQLRSFDAINPT